MVDLLKEEYSCSCSSKKMEPEKKSDLLALIVDYRLVREDDLVLYIRTSMEQVQRTCQKVELSGKISELLRELPLTCKERQRLMSYTKSFLPLWIRVLQRRLDATIVVGGLLLLTHMMKHR